MCVYACRNIDMEITFRNTGSIFAAWNKDERRKIATSIPKGIKIPRHLPIFSPW